MKVINKVLLVLIVLPVLMTYTTSASQFAAFSWEKSLEGFHVESEDLTTPVIDINKISVEEEAAVTVNDEPAAVEESTTDEVETTETEDTTDVEGTETEDTTDVEATESQKSDYVDVEATEAETTETEDTTDVEATEAETTETEDTTDVEGTEETTEAEDTTDVEGTEETTEAEDTTDVEGTETEDTTDVETAQNVGPVTSEFVLKDATSNGLTSSEAGLFEVQNDEKYNTEAGETVLEVQTPETLEGQVITYNLTSQGELTIEDKSGQTYKSGFLGFKEGEVQNLNTLDVYNGKIIGTDEGIVSTIGGTEQVVYAYKTLDEANTKTNGIPLSGGAFDAEYIDTVQSNGDYYAHVLISGLEGYISVDDIQIIPSSLIKSQSHYESVNGDWMYYEATDPLKANSYLAYAVGEAPEWAQEGVVYYSYDDETYSTNPMVQTTTYNVETEETDIEVVHKPEPDENTDTENKDEETNDNDKESTTVDGEYYSYFQNLPFNSTSSYTGSDYKNYLKYKGYTNSKYYNSTNAFVEAQEKEKVNSLYLFAMANHESLYGTSEFATDCNNFFGYGAYDSNPNYACTYHYDTPRDGILAQSIHLKQLWGDLEDRRWAGEELGSKSHGVNVYYASDSNWGKKIAQHMYDIDKYLGGDDLNYYKIYEITSTQYVYTSYSKNEKLQVSDANEDLEYYTIERDEGNPRVIVTGGNDDYFHFQLPTPRNNSSSKTCKWSDAISGSYPNFSQTDSIQVDNGVAAFACSYDSWSGQQGWYPRESSSGNTTYKVISGVPSKSPGSNTSGTDTEDETGMNSTCTKVITDTSSKLVRESEDGLKRCTTTYASDGDKKNYMEEVYYKDGSTKYRRYSRDYKSDGKTFEFTQDTRYDEDGDIAHYYEYSYENGNRIRRYSRDYYGDSAETFKFTQDTRYASDGDITHYYEYSYDSNGHKTRRYSRDYYSDGETFKFIQDTRYKSNGDLTDYYEYNYNASGSKTRFYHRVYSNGKKDYYEEYRYDSNGKQTYHKKSNY